MRDLSVARFAATFVLYAHMAMAQYSTGWNFTWPVATQQCANVSVSISGGVPPWVVGLMPIGGSPITWRVRTPDDGSNATLDNPVTATIPIQLTAGTLYTVMVTDQIGYAGGSGVSVMNPIGLQRVGESTDASCLTNISPVPQEFTFTTFGNAAACQDDFHIAWQDQVGRSPYSMTVVPLDTSYNPWDVALTGGVIQPDYAWTVNMTAGTKFTLIMTNRNGWGRGGVGQLYEVANGTGTASCVTQQNLGKVTLPLVATAAPLPQTASFTTTILPASAGQTSVTTTNQDAAETTATITTGRINPKESGGDSSNEGGNWIGNYRGEGGSSGSSTAAIAGGVAGGVVALLAAGLLTWFCIRRKRRNTVDKDGYQYSPPMDMNGGPNNPNGTGTYVGKLEPFTMPESNQAGQGAVPEMSYANNAQSHMHTMSPNMPYAPYDNRASIPFPMPVPVHSNSQDGSRDSYGPPPSQTAASSDGQGHEYGSSNGMCPAIRSSGAFGTGFGVAASGTAGAASASSTGNPYTDLKAASPPTFTSPRHSIPQLAPPFAAGSSSPGGAASAGAIGAGNRSDSGVPSNSPPLPTNSPVPGDNRTTHLSQGQSEGGGHPHQSFNFVRHLDGGALEIPEQGETIDLPPEYNDRRPQ